MSTDSGLQLRAGALCVALALGALGCGAQPAAGDTRAPVDGAPDHLGSVADASDASAHDASACAVLELPLVTTRSGAVADSQVVAIELAGAPAWLALDTGSPTTFLYSDPDGPQFVAKQASITLGCERLDLPGYRDDGIGREMFEGKPIVGILGLDLFLAVAGEIDYPAARIVIYRDPQRVPSALSHLPSVALHGREQQRALVDVTLDGQPVTLMFDTGAPDSLWLGVDGRPGDQQTLVQTADGKTWPVFTGSATLSAAELPARQVPMMRARSLGYLDGTMAALAADGLLGLSALGWRRIVLDFAAGRLRLGPERP